MADFLRHVQNALSTIEATILEPTSAEKLASESYLSPWYFQRIFRAYTGESVAAYLRRRRLTLALAELLNSQTSILDLALKFHFGSSEAFSRAFKRQFGVSPKACREGRRVNFPFLKPPLDPEQAKYLHASVRLEPEIVDVPGFAVHGIETRLPSPIIKQMGYLDQVSTVWKQFLPHLERLEHCEPNLKIGVAWGLFNGEILEEPDFLYLACSKVKDSSRSRLQPASPLVGSQVPGGIYAVFTFKGFHQAAQYVINYIYSTWLPNSTYLRNDGPEYTVLDHEHTQLDASLSDIRYFLPVVKRPGR